MLNALHNTKTLKKLFRKEILSDIVQTCMVLPDCALEQEMEVEQRFEKELNYLKEEHYNYVDIHDVLDIPHKSFSSDYYSDTDSGSDFDFEE